MKEVRKKRWMKRVRKKRWMKVVRKKIWMKGVERRERKENVVDKTAENDKGEEEDICSLQSK